MKRQELTNHCSNKKMQRSGVAAVEFAVVFPVVILFVLGLFELSAAYSVDSGLKIALTRGLREASIPTAQHADIEAEITNTLNLHGITAPDIEITPALISERTEEIQIRISVEPTGENGFILGRYYRNVMEREVTLRRL